MTAIVMRKLADALLNEGYVVKKMEDETAGFHEDKYTGRIIITVRPVEDEEADAEATRLRKEKEREAAKPENEEVKF